MSVILHLFHVTDCFMCRTHTELVMFNFSENIICVYCVKAYLCINVYVYLYMTMIFDTVIYCMSIICTSFLCLYNELSCVIVCNTCITCHT